MVITVPLDPEAWARLGRTIRKHREDAGYSRRALAERAGVSEKSIQVAEEGRVPRGRMPQSLSLIESALGWNAGSYVSILKGESWVRGTENKWTVEMGPEGAKRFFEKFGEPRPAPKLMSSREIELTQSGHLTQDVFMRQARRYRKLQGVSAEELAGKLSGKEPVLEYEDVKRLENGTRLLRMTEAQAIAAALGTTVDWLLGSGFSGEGPEEMRWPPNDKEMEAEANAVMRRISDVGTQLNAAFERATMAKELEAQARSDAELAMAMVQSITAQQQEMEKHYQYLLGRIDSIRAARGEETAIQIHPVYEEDDE